MIPALDSDHQISTKRYGPNKHIALMAYAGQVIQISEFLGILDTHAEERFYGALPEGHFLKTNPFQQMLFRSYVNTARNCYNIERAKLR